MTREEKQLLLKDLCERLPYGVILNVDNGKYREDKKLWSGLLDSDDLWDAKPYLRPMSSMTDEEKAKAYDEALERARKQKYDYQKEFDKTDKSSQLAEILRAGISAIELAFPELAESEDERIRKEIIDYLAHRADVTAFIDEEKDCKRWIAYLEKPKEQEHSDSAQFEEGFKTGLELGLRRQKEQKPAEWDKLQEEFRNINEAFEEGKKEVIANPKKYGLCKPAEWSEVCYGAKGDPDPAGVWKPSEEQSQVADASKMELEVDLEKEIDKGIADYSFTKTIDSGGFKTTVIDYTRIARHFYELGLNARKEE